MLWVWVASMLEDTLGGTALDSIRQLLSFVDGFSYTIYWEIINKALDVMRPFGLAMISAWFLIYMFDLATKDQITIDGLIKVLIQLVLAVAVIGNLDLIVNSFLRISETMLNAFVYNQSTNSVAMTGKDIADIWKAGGKTSLEAAMEAGFLNIAGLIAKVALYFAAISRLLDIGWRIVLAPVGCSNMFDGGMNSPGVRYLKGIFAAIISAVVLYVICLIGSSISASFIAEGVQYVEHAIIGTSGTWQPGMGGEAYTGTEIQIIAVEKMENSLLLSVAAMLATAGAAIGVSNKIKEVIS